MKKWEAGLDRGLLGEKTTHREQRRWERYQAEQPESRTIEPAIEGKGSYIRHDPNRQTTQRVTLGANHFSMKYRLSGRGEIQLQLSTPPRYESTVVQKGKQSDLERDCIVYCEVSHKSRFNKYTESLEGLGKHIRDCSRVRGADTLINNIEEK